MFIEGRPEMLRKVTHACAHRVPIVLSSTTMSQEFLIRLPYANNLSKHANLGVSIQPGWVSPAVTRITVGL